MNQKKLGWVFLVIGGMFETVWATTMFVSEAFTVPLWTAVTIFFLFVSTWVLNVAYTKGIPTGVGYSVWVGIGALGAVVVGALLYDEPVTLLRILFVIVIIAGIGGLEMSTSKKDKNEKTE